MRTPGAGPLGVEEAGRRDHSAPIAAATQLLLHTKIIPQRRSSLINDLTSYLTALLSTSPSPTPKPAVGDGVTHLRSTGLGPATLAEDAFALL
jgi:hypothetical protein